MKRVIKERMGQKGVTLLEVIVTLVVSSIFAVMMMQYMGSSMLKSTDPLVMAQDSATLTAVMEKVTADFNKLHADPVDFVNVLANLKTRIDSGTYNVNGCTVENSYVKFVHNVDTGEYDEVDDDVVLDTLKVTASRSTASGLPLLIISLFARLY